MGAIQSSINQTLSLVGAGAYMAQQGADKAIGSKIAKAEASAEEAGTQAQRTSDEYNAAKKTLSAAKKEYGLAKANQAVFSDKRTAEGKAAIQRLTAANDAYKSASKAAMAAQNANSLAHFKQIQMSNYATKMEGLRKQSGSLIETMRTLHTKPEPLDQSLNKGGKK